MTEPNLHGVYVSMAQGDLAIFRNITDTDYVVVAFDKAEPGAAYMTLEEIEREFDIYPELREALVNLPLEPGPI